MHAELEENSRSCRNVVGWRKEDESETSCPRESQQPPGWKQFIHPSRKNANVLQESMSPFLPTNQDASGLFSVFIIISVLDNAAQIMS